MVRVVVIAGLAWAVAGCGGGSPDRAQDPRARPAHTAAERVLTASDVDVLPPSGGAGLPVALVDAERQQLPVGVGVDVAGRVDEVRDVAPPRAVALGHLDGVAEEVVLGARPQLAEALDAELALLAARRVDGVLEAV